MIDVQCACKTLKQPNPSIYCAYTKVFVPAIADNLVYMSAYNPTKYNIWYDGSNLYFSYESKQYKWNSSSRIWEEMTWNGLTSFKGEDIWTDGTNIYYSYNGSHYKLNKDTHTWETTSFGGDSIGNGSYIWTDGTNIYYSYNGSHYKLNKETNQWETMQWNGTSFSGTDVWSDGTNIYRANNYRLNDDKSAWTSITITSNGSDKSGFAVSDIWSDGANVYRSVFINPGVYHYKFDRTALNWETINIGEDGYFSGKCVWTDGKNIYNNDYVLLPTTTRIYSKDATNAGKTSGWNKVGASGNGILFSINGVKYYTEEGMTWNQWIGSDYNIDGYVIDTSEGVVWYGTECQVLYNGNPILGSAEIISGGTYTHNTG